jgi:hypothetical protein
MMIVCVPSASIRYRLPDEFRSSGNSICAMWQISNARSSDGARNGSMATNLLSGWKTSTPILPACRNAIRQHRRTMSARRLHRIGRDFPTICGAKMRRSILMSASVPAAVARDLNVIADGPAQSLHPLQKCSVADLHVRIVRSVGHECAHAPHGLALLRACRERPSRRATERG